MAYARDHRPMLAVKAGAVAALAAGPVFLSTFLLGIWIEQSAEVIPVAFDDLGSDLGLAAILAMVSIPVGAIIAFLPCVLAAVLLAALAQRPGVTRLPMVWILAGGLAAGPIGLFIDGGAPASFAFAATGAICGAIARDKLKAAFDVDR